MRKDCPIVGIPYSISLRIISAMQLNRCMDKGWQMFAVTMNEIDEVESEDKTLDHPIL